MVTASHGLDGLVVAADDVSLVASAGLLLPATLAARLGVADLLDARVSGAVNPGGKALSVVASALAGGDCISDVDALRAGSTGSVWVRPVAAASTVGTWLRSLTWGQVRQLDAVSRELLARACAVGAVGLPATGPVVVDVDATVVETFGLHKSGARQVLRGGRRGYHPLVAALPGGGDVVHARLRRGRSNDASGAGSFVAEALARLVAAGAAPDRLVLRADSGFYAGKVIAACRRRGARFSVTARQYGGMRAAIAAIDEKAWTPVPYFEPGAAVAEIPWTAFAGTKQEVTCRLVVRRTPVPPAMRAARGQTDAFAAFHHHPFLTDCDGDPVQLDRFHRGHAEVELAIRDLKHGVGANHLPTKSFPANAAWLALQVLAHNLGRWTARTAGLAATAGQTMKTLRTRVLSVPGRLTRHARRTTLHLPHGWPRATPIVTGLQRLRALGPAG